MPELASHLRRIWRAQLANAPSALLDLDEASLALPGREAVNRHWIRANVAPVGVGPEGPLYVYEDLVRAATEHGARAAEPLGPVRWLSTDEAAALLEISRSTLDAMISRAPADLPGAPMTTGSGRRRRRRRWNAATLDGWLKAFTQWEAEPRTRSRAQTSSVSRRTLAATPVDWAAAARSSK